MIEATGERPVEDPQSACFAGFHLLRLLGEGAMGRVYLARQESPRRQVALKLLRAAAPREFLYRFRREAELLASLEHPNIARVYSAGSSDGPAGVPYLAMEYISGADLAMHARELPLADRMRLIITVCHAVHYAHTRGIVHRDLKPSNILVDPGGQPKVLDFGVAHVMQQTDAQTQMTAAGQILGTIPYIAPERLTEGSELCDPRTDVYALGVIAYELVAGSLPHPQLTHDTTLITALRIVTSEAPVRLGRVAPAARGDLETVVMKALAEDPERRYQSAIEFAADLQRYLELRPVEAQRPSASHATRLFIKRHRAASLSAAAIVAALLVGTTVSVAFALHARERLAEREAVTQFLDKMLTAADPGQALGERLTVRDVLDIARGELEGSASLPPAARVQLHHALGNTYVSIGRSEDGVEQLRKAGEYWRHLRGADSTEALEVELDLVAALIEAGRESEAGSVLGEVLTRLERQRHPDPRLLVQARIQDGALRNTLGHVTEARALLAAAYEAALTQFGAADELTLSAQHDLANVLNRAGDYEESARLSLDLYERTREAFGEKHPRTLSALEALAENQRELGHYEDAERSLRAVLAGRRLVLGAGHAYTLQAQAGLGAVLALAGRAEEGAPLVREAHEGLRAQLGDETELTRNVANLRAYAVSRAGFWDEAIDVYRLLIAGARANADGPTENDLPDYNNLGNALVQLGRYDEARTIFDELMPQAERLLPPDHLHRAIYLANYGDCLRHLGELSRARAALEAATAILEARLGVDHPTFRRKIGLLRQVYAQLGLREELAALDARLQ